MKLKNLNIMFTKLHIKFKKLVIILMNLIIIFAPNATVFALDDSVLDFFDQNHIYYYNPFGSSNCVAYNGTITVYGSTAAEKIWTGLTSFLTDEQAAGVMGNMQHESNSFNPAQHEVALMNAHQPGFDLGSNPKVSYGIGLIQWSGGRRIGIYNYIKSKSPDLIPYLENYSTYSVGYTINGDKFIELAGDDVANSLIAVELEYLKQELDNTSSYNGIYQQSTVYDTAKYFLEHIEIPQNPNIESHPERATDAQKYYDQFHGASIGSSGSSGSCGVYGDLANYVIRYAWPEHHNAPYVNRMPDYADIVATRQSAGKYVGGSVNGVAGIDCGGWVTTLLQESGFEPNYNDTNGATDTQEAWAQSHGWTRLNPSGDVDTSTLQPGDVAFTDGHTWVYVGEIEGFGSKIASASYSTDGDSTARAPMAGMESYSGARWYRKGNS